MQSFSMAVRPFKLKGHSFSVIQHTCRRYKIITHSEFVPENLTPCFSLPFNRCLSSWDDISYKRKVEKQSSKTMKKKSGFSKADVLKALSLPDAEYSGRKKYLEKERENESTSSSEHNNLSSWDEITNRTPNKVKKKQSRISKIMSRPADKLNTRSKNDVDKERDKNEDESSLSNLPPVVKYAIPGMFVRETSCTAQSNLIPIDSYSEVQRNKSMSKDLHRFCFSILVPCNIVYGFSASGALQRLCEITEKGTSIFGDGQHATVINELLALVAGQISTAENTSVKELLFYNFIVKDFPQRLFSAVHKKFKLSMNNDVYNVIELLDISEELNSLDTVYFDDLKTRQLDSLHASIWDHISRREIQITLPLLARFYKGAPVSHKGIFTVLQALLNKWINAIDLQDILDILNVQQSTHQAEKLSLISEWVSSTSDNLTVGDFENLLSGYFHCKHVCPVMIENLPKIVRLVLSKNSMTTKLICQIVSYCRNGLHFNGWLLEIACSHYIDNTKNYTAENLHALLQAIGVLNFMPESQRIFFTKVEDYLIENFYNIEISMLLEMFVSLIYLDKVAVNFMPYIFSPIFLGIVYEFEAEKRIKASQNIRLIEKAFTLRGFVPSNGLPYNFGDMSASRDNCTTLVYNALLKIVNRTCTVKCGRKITFTAGVNIEMDYMDLADWADVKIPKTRSKFIILPLSEDSFCKNKPQRMLGHEATNIRILTESGNTVAQINNKKITNLAETNQLSTFLKSLLMEQVLEKADKQAVDYTDNVAIDTEVEYEPNTTIDALVNDRLSEQDSDIDEMLA